MIKIVSVLIIIFILLQTMVMVYLMVQKRKKRYHKYRENLIKEKVFVEIQNYIQNGVPLRTRLLKTEQYRVRIIEQVLSDYMELFADEQTKTRVQKLAEDNLSTNYLARLKSGQWSDRMNTLYFIEGFKIYSLVDEVWDLFLNKDEMDVEKQQLARTLAALQDQRFLNYMLETKEMWFLSIYKDVLRRLDPSNFSYLIQSYHSIRFVELKSAVLALIGEKQDISYINLVCEEILSQHLEIRIQALKTIAQLEYVTDVSIITPFMDSEIWQERMLFAKVIKALKIERYKRDLFTLMGDENWWVRYAAAEALAHYKDGQILLQYILEKHTDRYARDMAIQWLSKV